MPMVYNDNNGNYEWQDDPAEWQAPPPPEQLGSYGVPINSGAPAGQQDLSYWQSRHDEGLPGPAGGGNGVEDMFDLSTGQLKPGWARTAKGYEWVGLPQASNSPGTSNYTGDYSLPGQGGGSGGSSGGGFNGWPSYASPQFSDPGTFDPGTPFSYPDFSYKEFAAPSGQDVLKDPGFQFRMDQGRKALEASAAGRGVLRSGGTLKNLMEYGQNFGSQEFGNVWNRALQEYDTNRGNAFGSWDANRGKELDSWQSGYTGRKDAFGFNADRSNSLNNFNLSNSQTDFSGKQRQAEAEFSDLFNRWAKSGDWLTDISGQGAD